MSPGASASTERLGLLVQLSQAFNSSLDLDQVLNTVIDAIISAMHAERGFVVLRGPGGVLEFRAARGINQTTINDPQFEISRGVIDQVIREGKPVLTSNAQMDSRFMNRQSVAILGLASILCAPLKVRDETLGAVYLDNRLQAGVFTENELDLLSAISASAAIAIENARLYQVAVEKGRMENELQVARNVQSSLIPEEAPKLPGWDFASCWLPARVVAGDFYDFFQSNDASLNVVIADVSDKGFPAALFMADSRSLVRASMLQARNPLEGFTTANRLICADSSSGMFLTLFYAHLEQDSGKVTFINAGHNPPLLYRQGKTHPAQLSRTGMAMGVEESASYQLGHVTLKSGDTLLLYTDGLPDAINSEGQGFGMSRLDEVIQAHRHENIQSLLTSLQEALSSFIGEAEPFDDITAVAIQRH